MWRGRLLIDESVCGRDTEGSGSAKGGVIHVNPLRIADLSRGHCFSALGSVSCRYFQQVMRLKYGVRNDVEFLGTRSFLFCLGILPAKLGKFVNGILRHHSPQVGGNASPPTCLLAVIPCEPLTWPIGFLY
jgi:hypothetical protein